MRARVICLDIPDNYAFMDPELVRLLEAKVTNFWAEWRQAPSMALRSSLRLG